MYWVYWLVRFFPYWALPMILISGELGWYYHRKRHAKKFGFVLVMVVLIVGLVFWIMYRGDLNSLRWVEYWFQ